MDLYRVPQEEEMIHFLIVTLGSRDLMELAIASIDKYAGACNLDIVDLPADTTDPWAHGRAIDFWRQRQKVGILDKDIVIIMDPDVAILSEWWRRELDTAFADPKVGIWGAGSTEDFGPRVHASMMAVRGVVFNESMYSFMPQSLDHRWRDTGGNYCRLVQGAGWELRRVERGMNWHDFSTWYVATSNGATYGWTHLGGGSHSDPSRMTRWQRIKNWRAIQRREQWKRLVKEHLRGGLIHGRPHDPRTAWDHT